jgi:hypothetical protein
MHGGKMELLTVYQQNAGLDAAELHGNPVDYRVEEFVELKNGTDLMRCLLNRKQNIYSALLENCRTQGGSRITGGGWHGNTLNRTYLDSCPAGRMRKINRRKGSYAVRYEVSD